MDTIYAVSSGKPPAAIAIIRISGADAMRAAAALAGALPSPYQARLRALRHPQTRELLDRCLVLAFPAPSSATGEDLVEFQVHGGRAVIAAVMAALSTIDGLRPAEPGEFTRRALMHGRIDLAQAEGLGDLLAAETEGQRKASLAVAEGAVSRAVDGWNRRLLEISASIEAELDFSDEADVAVDDGAAHRAIAALADEMATVLAAPSTARLRDGVHVVLGGPPNSGKSALFNVLAGREASIVSPISGTTRDRIEAPVTWGGTAFVLSDTAGLIDESDDPIERIGVERAAAAMREADIVIWLGDADPPDPAWLWLWPRADGDRIGARAGRLSVSAFTGAGISELRNQLLQRAGLLVPREDQLALNDRQKSLCEECLAWIAQARDEADPLLVAESLRLARRALDRVTGRSDVEAMLDRLFASFCIGK